MEKFRSLLTKTLPFTLALFIGFATLRLYEFLQLEADVRISFSIYLQGLGIDLMFSLLITGIFILIQRILMLFRFKNLFWIMIAISLFALIINFILIQYFFFTKIPLDEAIYFFSIKELKLIAGGENRISWQVYLFLGAFIVGYFLLLKLLRKFTPNGIVTLIFGIAILLSLVFPSLTHANADTESKKAIALDNRLAYFAHRSFIYFNQDEWESSDIKPSEFRKLDANFYGGKSISEEYPLLHELPATSEFANFINKSPKGPPNIVFIMVESLSTTLVGEKGEKTGNLLPFLDSLSKESLYWPNFMSTCDRTHNVLPASLASVPYTTKGNLFQQLEFPNHWSLYSLLNTEYFTRFYCGVDLNFSNMNGYMNFYQTDYIVKNWEKQFVTKFSERETPWGFPDGVLFDKSWLDHKNQQLANKKRLDVFLTISTHDPFVIPREKHYTDLVMKSIAKIKNPTETHQYVKDNPRPFATFVYLDDELRHYFEKAKNNPDFDNTIFLIYGDHGTEHCLYDKMSRYKIPLIIYSPLLKKPETFRGVSTQLDLAPTLLNYLRLTFGMKLPSAVPFLGKELSFSKKYECKRSLVLGTAGLKGQHVLHRNYFMFHNELYQVKDELEIVPYQNEKIRKEISEQRRLCDLMADYTIFGNKILPLSLSKSYIETEEFEEIYNFSLAIAEKSELSKEFIGIGKDLKLDENTKYIRIQFECDYYNGNLERATELPKLTMSLEQKSNGKNESLIWKQIDYHQVKNFTKKSWNHLSATITIRMSDYQKLKSENLLKYYILNMDKKYFNIKNIETKIFRDR